jgi:hypothetical protein
MQPSNISRRLKNHQGARKKFSNRDGCNWCFYILAIAAKVRISENSPPFLTEIDHNGR